MNALEENAYTEAWSQIGKTIERPKAIVCISAHWHLPATIVVGMPTAFVNANVAVSAPTTAVTL